MLFIYGCVRVAYPELDKVITDEDCAWGWKRNCACRIESKILALTDEKNKRKKERKSKGYIDIDGWTCSGTVWSTVWWQIKRASMKVHKGFLTFSTVSFLIQHQEMTIFTTFISQILSILLLYIIIIIIIYFFLT